MDQFSNRMFHNPLGSIFGNSLSGLGQRQASFSDSFAFGIGQQGLEGLLASISSQNRSYASEYREATRKFINQIEEFRVRGIE